jgi:hypothetical protein
MLGDFFGIFVSQYREGGRLEDSKVGFAGISRGSVSGYGGLSTSAE